MEYLSQLSQLSVPTRPLGGMNHHPPPRPSSPAASVKTDFSSQHYGGLGGLGPGLSHRNQSPVGFPNPGSLAADPLMHMRAQEWLKYSKKFKLLPK